MTSAVQQFDPSKPTKPLADVADAAPGESKGAHAGSPQESTKKPPPAASPAEKKPPPAAKPAEAKPKNPQPQPNKVEPNKSAKAPTTEPSINGQIVARLRRQRARRLGIRFAIFVLLPTLLASIYYGAFASDQFESHSVFTVHSAQSRPSLGIEGLLGAVGGTATLDTMAIRDYVLSRDMLARLDKEHGFIDHYKAPNVDYLSRLAQDASFEDAYEYYLKTIHLDFDSTSGSLALRVRAFSPEKSKEFAQAITAYSEEMVNGLSERERNDQTRYAQLEVEKCEKRLIAARQALLVQQQTHAEFNPMQTAHASMTIRTELEGALAKARAELSAARSFMTPTAPRVVELEARVNAISGQVAAEKKRLVDPKSENSIAESMAQFEAVFVEKEFAEKSYETAMAALEVSRADAARQHRYLAIVATPSTPDESTYPDRAVGVLTAFVLSFLLLGIGSLLVAAVREHARV